MNRRRRATDELEDPPPARRRRVESDESEESEESKESEESEERPRGRPLEFHMYDVVDEPIGTLREDSPLYEFLCRLERAQIRHIRHIHIHVCRTEVRPFLVVPIVFLFFSFTTGVEDSIVYQPSGDRHQHCTVRRRNRRREYVVENRSSEVVAADEILAFLTACTELNTKIVMVELTINTNPRVDYDRLQSFRDQPLQMLGLFRNIFRRVDSSRFGIEILKIDVQNKTPLREILLVTQFVHCLIVQLRIMEFIEASLAAARETIGTFGLNSTVGLWLIHTTVPIEEELQTTTRIPGFSREGFNELMVFARIVGRPCRRWGQVETGPAPMNDDQQNPAPPDVPQEQQPEPAMRNVSNFVRIL